MHIRNITAKRIQALKNEIIYKLWTSNPDTKINTTISAQEFWNIGNDGFNIFCNL